MNIDAGLKKLIEQSSKDKEHCNNYVSRAELHAVLEAMKAPSGCDGLARFNERLLHLEKLEDYVKELKGRVAELERRPHHEHVWDKPTARYETVNIKYSSDSIKPSVPEKPFRVFEGDIDDKEFKEVISIQRDVAEQFYEYYLDNDEKWSTEFRDMYDAIKQALKG